MKELSQLSAAVGILGIVVAFLVNVILAIAVRRDAMSLRDLRGGLYLFGPLFWGVITFVFSLAGFALYWAVHHSSLRSTIPPQNR